MRRRRYRGYRNYRRSAAWERFKRIFIALLIVVPIISGLTYILLFYPVNIDSGVVVEKKETEKAIKLKLSYNDRTRWVTVDKNLNLSEADAYSVSIKGVRLLSIVPCKTYTGKVLQRSSEAIVIEDRRLSVGPNIRYLKLEGNKVVNVSPNNVIVGYSTYKFITDQQDRVRNVLIEAPEISFVRVGISNADFSSLNHEELIFSSRSNEMDKNNENYLKGRGFIIKTTGLEYKTKGNEPIQLNFKDGKITIVAGSLDTKYNFTPKQTLGTTTDRIYISSIEEAPILITSLKRSSSYKPVYYGSLEVFVKDNSMRLINEVPIEQYLRFVVPSEMSPYAKAEGYKAQAVAARTYVLSDMLSGRFAKSGFHVDDTVQSQVYNAQPARSEIDTAIAQTSGEVLTYEDKIIDAKYYSTSHGFGAPFNEVWYTGDDYKKENPEPYLTFKNYTELDIRDLSDEKVASEFFKDWTIQGIDSEFKLFRWKLSIDAKALKENINSQIYERYKNDPDSFKKKWLLNIYRKTEIPKEGIGTIQNIYISKRGKAGNVMEMTIESSTGTYRVEKALNIKRLIVPRDENLKLTTKLGGNEPLQNYGFSLPSSFFVIDHEYSGSTIKSITIYGGGFGHGAGMSQNGVVSLERQNKNYRDILFTYYNGVELTDYKNILKNE